MTPELQRVLWACYQCWASSPVPPDQRMICYEWISGAYRDKFAADFHQSRLAALVKLGFLRPGHSVRGGARRYYTIVDPPLVERHLRGQ